MATTAIMTRKRPRRNPTKDTSPTIRVRGELLEYKSGKAYYPPDRGSKKHLIYEMSRAARLRMLKYVATIKLGELPMSVFITLTYPDSKTDRDYSRRARDRSEFIRKVEAHLGYKVCGLWKTEWVPRKSGALVGQDVPHVHMLLFGIRYIHYTNINLWWQDVIQYHGYVRTEIKRTRGKRQTAYYAAKYIGKVKDNSFINAVQLRTPDGRHWGYLRGYLIPRWEEEWLMDPTEEQTRYVLHVAKSTYPQGDFRNGESLTLLGAHVRDAVKILREMGLTVERRKL